MPISNVRNSGRSLRIREKSILLNAIVVDFLEVINEGKPVFCNDSNCHHKIGKQFCRLR